MADTNRSPETPPSEPRGANSARRGDNEGGSDGVRLTNTRILEPSTEGHIPGNITLPEGHRD